MDEELNMENIQSPEGGKEEIARLLCEKMTMTSAQGQQTLASITTNLKTLKEKGGNQEDILQKFDSAIADLEKSEDPLNLWAEEIKRIERELRDE